nr:hypothetical protein CFP56_19409 [Quercus suber]
MVICVRLMILPRSRRQKRKRQRLSIEAQQRLHETCAVSQCVLRHVHELRRELRDQRRDLEIGACSHTRHYRAQSLLHFCNQRPHSRWGPRPEDETVPPVLKPRLQGRVLELREYLVDGHAGEVWGEEDLFLLRVAVRTVYGIAGLDLGLDGRLDQRCVVEDKVKGQVLTGSLWQD